MCFTDIEGSTRLARRFGDRWRDVLGRHNELLRAAWESHGGCEVKTEGDAFFVAFDHPGDALNAALAAQQSVSGEPWPDDVELRVRIGVHTGEVEVVEDDYVGIEVHRAARVAGAAQGGQVLVSAATAAALGTEASPAAPLRELGAYSLKDFDEGEVLFAVDHDDLRNDLPPRALPLAAHNLPLLRTSFVGRLIERIELEKLVAETAMVTVVGPGGLGKTRIALEVARELTSGFPDGVWAVLLAGEAAGEDVVPVVARTLGVPELPGASLIDSVVEHLAAKELLVLLDNCEHVVDSAAVFVERVLASAPGVHVLATSRQPLGLRGERVWTLPPLTTPSTEAPRAEALLDWEAAALFVDRATAANPRFALSDESAPAVAAICRELDGLPLAVELAAVATRAVPLDALASRIGDSTRMLRGNRTDDPRQQSIDGLIGWSYDLLDDTQRAVFRRLSVFRGGWTLASAEAVCAGDGVEAADVLPALADLVDRSMINIDADDRYRMLVLVRRFAEQKLCEAGEDDATSAALLSHLATTATTHTIIEAEVDNLRHAFAHAAATDRVDEGYSVALHLSDFLLRRGHFDETKRLLQAALDLVGDRPAEQVKLLSGLSQIAHVQGEVQRAEELADRMIDAARAAGDHDSFANGVVQKAASLSDRDPAAAVALIEEALALPVSPGYQAWLHEKLALAQNGMGDSRAGAETALHAAELWESVGQPVRAVITRLATIDELNRQGREQELNEILDAALDEDVVKEPRVIAHALYSRSRIALAAGRFEGVEADLDRAIETTRATGELRIIGAYLCERARLRLATGHVDDAQADLVGSLTALRDAQLATQYDNALALAAAYLDRRGEAALAASLAATVLAGGDDDVPFYDEIVRLASASDDAAPPMATEDALDAAIAAVGAS